MLLIGGSIAIVVRFKIVQDNFLNASKGSINKRKMIIYGWNITPQHMHSITQGLQFLGVTNCDSFNYLGTPILIGNPKSSICQGIVRKIKKKMSQ
jgi:hypothetical protein